MKKVVVFILSVLLLFGNSLAISAQTSEELDYSPSTLVKDVITLSDDEVIRLKGLGFTQEEIDEMTYETYKKQDGLYGKVVETKDTYYRVTKNGRIEISKEQAEKEVKEYKEKQNKKGKIKIANVDYTDVESNSWMKVTTTVTKYQDQYYRYTGKYRFKHNWNWLVTPAYKLVDVVGLTYSSYFTYSANTEYSLYRFDRMYVSGNYKDTISLTKYTADKKAANTGIAFKVDLLADYGGYDTYNHRGMMYFDTTLANTGYTSGNVYGHYAHTEVAISSLSINLASGNISVSGATKVSYMTDTGVSFATK